MPTPPLCKLCKTRHWGYDHDFSNVPLGTSERSVVSAGTSQRSLERHSVPAETTYVPTEAEMINAAVSDTHACPICGAVHRRPATNAERKRAYRQRQTPPHEGASAR